MGLCFLALFLPRSLVRGYLKFRGPAMASALCKTTQLHTYHPSPPLPWRRGRRHSSLMSIPSHFFVPIRSTQQGVFCLLRKQPGTRSCVISAAAAASSSSSFNGRADHDSGKEQNETITEKAWKHIQKANTFLPQVVMASTLLALLYPPSFTWFTNRYYAPALGFLMFAVGINLNPTDFIHAFQRPWVLVAGYLGQFMIKPVLGVLFATIGVSLLHLPPAIASGMILVSCVSGAQLSNYATFLVEPTMAPLSIVMTALSTATAVFVTPALTLLLLGKRLPVDVYGMIINITQIVVAPIAAGIALNRFAASLSSRMRPFMPLLSVIVTSLCVGSPLAMNIEAVRSPFGLAVLLLVIGFHSAAFLLGFYLSKPLFWRAPDVMKLQKTLSFETGMQSSLLGLALANKFFADPLVGLPSAISTVLMSLMGFALVLYWNNGEERASHS